jgi:hypothetical protein
MAGLAETIQLPDLTVAAPVEGAAEGGPRPLFTFACRVARAPQCISVRSYTPFNGGRLRLLAIVAKDEGSCMGVWDTGTGAFLQALRDPDLTDKFTCIVAYPQRPDGRYAVAAGSNGGRICAWDGDDFRRLFCLDTNPTERDREASVSYLVAYEEPASGRVRLVSAA